MSGTVRGKIDCFHIFQSAYTSAQEIFKNLFDLLNSHPNLTRKALYYGRVDVATPNADGAGTGYWNEVGGFGSGAFAVFTWEATTARPYTFDMLIQYGAQSGVLAPGLPAFIAGNALTGSSGEFGIAVAMSIGGDPWGGTTNNDGTDSKSNPVWVLGGGSDLIVMPASNSTGQGNGVSKDNMAMAFRSQLDTSPRVNFLCDDDYLAVSWELWGEEDTMNTTVIGPYTPDQAHTISRPMVMLWNDIGLELPGDNYTTANSGIVPPDAFVSGGNECIRFTWYGPGWARLPANQPGEITGLTRETELHLVGTTVGMREFLGILPGYFAAHAWALPGMNVSLDRLRSYHCTSTTQADVLCLPWDGVTVPRSNFTRAGVSF